MWSILLEMARRSAIALSLAAYVLAASPALAEPADEPLLQPARELWTQGQRYFHDGEYVRATDSFDRAYEIERVPSLGIWVARSLARSGRLLQAELRYRDIAEQSLPADAPQKDWSAKRNADVERRLLAQRIASVSVWLEGAPEATTRVTVNGETLPPGSFGVPRRVNPGLVKVHSEALGRVVDADVELAEGESRRVRLSFVIEPKVPDPALAKGAAPSTSGKPGEVEGRHHAAPGQTQRVLSYVAVGLGGAALLTGAAFGFLALDDQAQLQAACPNDRCPPELATDVDSYDSKRAVASVALLSGAALVTTGVVLFLTAPSADSHSGVRAAVVFRGSSVGLTGQF